MAVNRDFIARKAAALARTGPAIFGVVPVYDAQQQHIGTFEVGIDFGDRALLIRRQRERKRGAVALDQLTGLHERRRRQLLAPTSAAGKPDLEDEKLVECQPVPRGLGFA